MPFKGANETKLAIEYIEYDRFEEEVENRLADSQVQIERPIDKLELPDAAIEQRLHRRQKRFELRLPDGNFEGRQAELAGKRATA